MFCPDKTFYKSIQTDRFYTKSPTLYKTVFSYETSIYLHFHYSYPLDITINAGYTIKS